MKSAHSKVKSGADFLRYVQEIKNLGLKRYKYFLSSGMTIYYGDNNHKVQTKPDRILTKIQINPDRIQKLRKLFKFM